jgi:hypothetical protein
VLDEEGDGTNGSIVTVSSSEASNTGGVDGVHSRATNEDRVGTNRVLATSAASVVADLVDDDTDDDDDDGSDGVDAPHPTTAVVLLLDPHPAELAVLFVSLFAAFLAEDDLFFFFVPDEELIYL